MIIYWLQMLAGGFCLAMAIRAHDEHFMLFACLCAVIFFSGAIAMCSKVGSLFFKDAESYFPSHNEFMKDGWNA